MFAVWLIDCVGILLMSTSMLCAGQSSLESRTKFYFYDEKYFFFLIFFSDLLELMHNRSERNAEKLFVSPVQSMQTRILYSLTGNMVSRVDK